MPFKENSKARWGFWKQEKKLLVDKKEINMITKISLYLKLGLLVLIISLLVFIGIQYLRITTLEKNVSELEIKNSVLTKDKKFYEAKINILSQFSNSTSSIVNITNEIIFTSKKQMAIDKVLEDFCK